MWVGDRIKLKVIARSSGCVAPYQLPRCQSVCRPGIEVTQQVSQERPRHAPVVDFGSFGVVVFKGERLVSNCSSGSDQDGVVGVALMKEGGQSWVGSLRNHDKMMVREFSIARFEYCQYPTISFFLNHL